MTIEAVTVGPGELWMMHVRGPDDMIPAPDHWTALAWCNYVNGIVAPKAPSILFLAAPGRWLGTAEEHAQQLPEAVETWRQANTALYLPVEEVWRDALHRTVREVLMEAQGMIVTEVHGMALNRRRRAAFDRLAVAAGVDLHNTSERWQNLKRAIGASARLGAGQQRIMDEILDRINPDRTRPANETEPD